jgi:catechol 2,3-dioxygenase-like lactoylglutathione lyase family enzyme
VDTEPTPIDQEAAVRAKLATINLQVADPQRSKRFYMDALGMIEDVRRSHPPTFVYLRSDGCDVTLATPQETSEAQPSRTIELGFEVDDIAAMRAHLSALSIPDYREKSMGWGETLELRDSDGHRVVIYSFKTANDPGPR